MNIVKRLGTFDSLALRDFRLLWLGQLSTSLGQWMDQTARSWLVYEMTGSPLQLGLVSATRGAPLLIFGILAGVAADRYNRKIQLVVAQVVNAILNAILATLILTGHIQVWHIYVTGFLNGTVQAFQQPARQVLINDLVGEKHLLNAISLNSAAFNLSRGVGPAICGILIVAFGVDISYFVQAALYAFATVWTIQITVPNTAATTARMVASTGQSVYASAKEGFQYILKHRLILSLMILALAPVILGMPYTSLLPIFAKDVLHGNSATQGLLLSMVGAGALIGALTMASLGRRQGSGKLLILGACGFGASLVVFSQSPILGMAMIFAFLAGLSNAAYTSQEQTIIQGLAPSDMRGRILGIYMLNRGLMPLGSLIAGTLANFLGGPWAVTIMGSSCVVVAVSIALATPQLWRLKGNRVFGEQPTEKPV